MSLIVQFLQGAAAVSAIVFGYVKLTGAERASAHTLVKRLVVLTAMAIIVAVSIWHVTTFALGDGSPSRKEIMWLLLNLWNMTTYTFFCIGLSAYLLRKPLYQAVDQPVPTHSTNGNSEPQ